jgi:hypothetical protein
LGWLVAARFWDLAEEAHLYLLVTGAPLALFSLHLPNGSVQAIIAAGALGAVQWTLVGFISAWFERRERRHSDRDTAV